jgi:hypothetical protein
VKVGPRQFARDAPLPDPQFAGANLRPQSLVNGPEGRVRQAKPNAARCGQYEAVEQPMEDSRRLADWVG